MSLKLIRSLVRGSKAAGGQGYRGARVCQGRKDPKGAKVARSSRSHGQKSRAGVLPQCACRAPDEPPAATDARTEACAAAEAGPVISGLSGKFRVG